MMAKYLATSLAMLKGGQRAARHQQLLAGLDDLQQLGRVAVQVDHVAGLLGRLRAGVHGHRHVGLGQRRCVVGAVAGHRHQPAFGLVVADHLQLGFGRGLGQEVVDTGLGGDGRGGEPVVAGDHHRLDAHAAQFGKALLDAALDDVLQLDHTQHACGRRDTTSGVLPLRATSSAALCTSAGKHAAQRFDMLADGFAGALAQHAHAAVAASISTPLMRVCAVKATKCVFCAVKLALAQVELLLGQHGDAAAFGRLVGHRRELRRIGRALLA